MSRATWFLSAALLIVAFGQADAGGPKHKLRISTAAPDGTSWAKTFNAFAHDVEKSSGGDVEVKIYFGSIAGDEEEVYKLLQAGKLDGVISGGPLCRRVIPSMRAFEVVGLFQTQDEATHVVTELRPTLDREAHDAGYVMLGAGSIGPHIIFSTEPITTMTELRKTRLWQWDLNEGFIKNAAELKLSIVPRPLTSARKTFDDKQIDGFITTPVTALAFQWYVGTKYITDLRTGYAMGCFLMRESALDALSPEHQAIVRKAGMKVGMKIEAETRRMDQKLLGDGVYTRLGLKVMPVSEKFRAQFFEASRAARQRLGNALVPSQLLDKVSQLLADYRAEHH
jgi:TRAP-type transport system periplasmic protein